LDKVEIAAGGDRSQVRGGVIAQVRRFPDGHFEYVVGGVGDDGEGGGLYRESDLRATGERAPIDVFALRGSFKVREVVRISDKCDDAEIAGRTGVIDGGYSNSPESDGIGLSVWIEELSRSVVVDSTYLISTGERLPADPLNREEASSQVNAGGKVLGKTRYIVVDDVEAYL
jgi:hypothetical protein